ncbi:tetratricopeptide repeat-containing sensor histidine kinase [Pedobacter sp. AW31-3R]|uniref:tetratricopeptide repeat-containing sensor histidine kinase n=1 Tax=Pedobacter sp. AW31-3R TaxID=3445781 RepID=UPI003FA109D3
MKPLVILFVLMVNLSVCTGQTDNVQMIQAQIPRITDSLKYVDALNRLAMLYYERNLDSTFNYTTRAREIANRLDYTKGKADALNNLGIVFDLKGDLQLALRYYNESYNYYKAIADSSNIIQTSMNIAMVYTELDKKQKSMDIYKDIFSSGKSLKNDSIMSLVIYNYMLQYPEALNKDSISAYIDKAKSIALKYKDTRVLLAINQLIGVNAIKNKEREKGIAILQKTLEETLKENNFYLSMDMLVSLGDLFVGTDSAKAIAYYKQGLKIAELKAFHVYAKIFVKKLHDFYTVENKNTEAFYYSEQLVKLFEIQEAVNNKSGVDYMEYALKDQQLELARTQSKYQFGFLILALLLCVMTIVIIIILWRNWKNTQKTAEALRLQFKHSEATMETMDIMNKNYALLIKVVAHDLLNPIGAISAMTGLIPKGSISADVQEYIDLIQSSSKNCLELINELMKTDFDQQQNLTKTVLDIGQLLRQCGMLLAFRARDKRQELVLHNHVEVSISGDEEKILRVINNLIVNAIKFSQPDTVIYINCEQLEQEIRIDIQDNGVGIPVGLQDKIFDPFTSSKRKGTQGEQPFGLGLYISKQIIEAHHGRIWFESEAGKGSTFYLSLPIAPQPRDYTENFQIA